MIGASDENTEMALALPSVAVESDDEYRILTKKHSGVQSKASRGAWSKISRTVKKSDDDIFDRDELMKAEIDVEFCERLLSRPSSRNYAALNSYLKICTSERLREFLECNALGIMFAALGFMGLKKNSSFSDAVVQLELVMIIKTVLNQPVGMQFLIEDEELVKQLALALDTGNMMVKKQVFEMLSGVCLYDDRGYELALSSLDYFKMVKGQRYRFSILINEFKSEQLAAYKATVLAFINALIMCTVNYNKRRKLRNELIGLGLLELLTNVRHIEDDDLYVQLSVFEDQKIQDDDGMVTPEGIDLNDHEDVFKAVFNQIAEKPVANNFLAIMQSLLLIDNDNVTSDKVWDSLEALVKRAVLITTEKQMEQFAKYAESEIEALKKKLAVGIHDRLVHGCEVATQTETMPSQINSKSPVGGIPLPGLAMSSSSNGQTFLPAPSPPPPQPPVLAGGTPRVEPLLPAHALSPDAHMLSVGDAPAAWRSASPPPQPTGTPDFESPPSSTVTDGGPPPPPPPPPGFGPPAPVGGPPPPPPFVGASHPPPPPGLAPGIAWSDKRDKVTPKVKPKSKMKKLQWNKLPHHVLHRSSSSVWLKVQDMDGVEPDYRTEEELFCQEEKGKEGKKDKEKNEASKEVSILDGKRSLNVNIFLRQFKGGSDEIIDLIKKGDGAAFQVDRLKCLEKLLPDPNEIELLKSYKGDKAKLGPAERFFLELMGVSSYSFRIEGLIVKEEFLAAKESLKPNIEIMRKAIDDILTCDVLPELLALILRVGNFLNHGSNVGNAEGFKINSLLKITDTRANKPRMNLLHFIVQIAENKKEQLLDFPSYMKHLDAACRLNLDNLDSEVNVLKGSLSKMESRLEKSPDDVRRQFCDFVEESLRNIKDLEGNIQGIRKKCADFADYFCEDPAKFKLEEGLSIVKTFSDNLKQAKEENAMFKKQEAKKIEREKKMAEDVLRREGPVDKIEKVQGKKRRAKGGTSIIDNLLDEIKHGFPLKKRSLPNGVSTASPPPTRPVASRPKVDWKKTASLATFLVTGSKIDSSHQSEPESSHMDDASVFALSESLSCASTPLPVGEFAATLRAALEAVVEGASLDDAFISSTTSEGASQHNNRDVATVEADLEIIQGPVIRPSESSAPFHEREAASTADFLETYTIPVAIETAEKWLPDVQAADSIDLESDPQKCGDVNQHVQSERSQLSEDIVNFDGKSLPCAPSLLVSGELSSSVDPAIDSVVEDLDAANSLPVISNVATQSPVGASGTMLHINREISTFMGDRQPVIQSLEPPLESEKREDVPSEGNDFSLEGFKTTEKCLPETQGTAPVKLALDLVKIYDVVKAIESTQQPMQNSDSVEVKESAALRPPKSGNSDRNNRPKSVFEVIDEKDVGVEIHGQVENPSQNVANIDQQYLKQITTNITSGENPVLETNVSDVFKPNVVDKSSADPISAVFEISHEDFTTLGDIELANGISEHKDINGRHHPTRPLTAAVVIDAWKRPSAKSVTLIANGHISGVLEDSFEVVDDDVTWMNQLLPKASAIKQGVRSTSDLDLMEEADLPSDRTRQGLDDRPKKKESFWSRIFSPKPYVKEVSAPISEMRRFAKSAV